MSGSIMDDENLREVLKRIQQVLVRRFREAGRLYVRTKEVLIVDGIDDSEERKIPMNRIGVMEDPYHMEGYFRALFALKEPYRARISLISRGRYKVLGEGELGTKEREKAAEVEDHLNMRVYDDDEDGRKLPEICPHELRPYEGHPIVIGHKTGMFDGTVVIRPYGNGIYIKVGCVDSEKIFGVGNFIGGTLLVHDTLYRITERKMK